MNSKTPTNTKKHSLNCLNWLNFSAADVATGLGPFLAVYLASNLHWNPSQIGVAIGAMSFATVIAQSPAGWLCDVSKKKRLGIVVVSITIGIAGFCMLFFPNFYAVIICQIAIGVAAAFFAPVLIALAMGIAGRNNFDNTISKNQTFNHAGNVVSAILIGVLGKLTHNAGIFYGLALFCLMSIIFSLSIKEEDINHEAASAAGDKKGTEPKKTSFLDMLKNKGFLILLFSAVLFHFANAAMLPLVGQELGKARTSNASLYMSACIVLAQLVMVPMSFMSGRWAATGRKKLMMIAFFILPIRGILYTFGKGAIYLVSIQILDGVAGGIFSVVSILIVSDLFCGTGKDNFAQGILAAAIGLGASLSNVISGYIVKASGFNFGFYVLSALALVAFLLFWAMMPETVSCADEKPGNKDMKLNLA
ncbi:MFS transporter [Mucilaginibacter phyllosphaerae]|uniref:MFS family permease n=1 Tax=Mucilaginibacter phyllosphaerae TaxID=1812349 RepID=A0A4Y8AB63_9SPHI|nr:MFS transporter [Mucilaginibacter phyllosphaerae]MBB3969492.1 MFS family permease [Mucilaginibacter phyllosphaerae]TEW65730.1 MFS transporter [Mucilaginibacter phyllosphaerae]GGH08940.1 MFS transporter [Mucilaginibacter phyllosphaerae]